MKSLLISIIIGIICITCLIILFVKMKNINENLNKHITTDLKELPDEITLNKLKVKDLEVDDRLSTSLIYNKNDEIPIAVSSPIWFTKDMTIQNDKLNIHSNNMLLNNDVIEVNPELTLTTEFYKDKAINHQKPLNLVNINETTSDINMKFNLKDVVYTLYNNENKKNKTKETKEEIIENNENKDKLNYITINDDDNYIYDENNEIIGVKEMINPVEYPGESIKNDKGEITGEKAPHIEDDYYIYDMWSEPKEVKKDVKHLKFNDNDIIVISKKLKDYLQNAIDYRYSNVYFLIRYPQELVNKIKNNKYKIKDENNENIETFIDIPSYNYYIYE